MDEPGTDRIRRGVEVANTLGLTMRAAAKFVVVAQQYQADILVFDGDKELNGKSLVDLATLIAPCGTRLDLEARGPDARGALAALAGLLASRSHGEAEESVRGAPTRLLTAEDKTGYLQPTSDQWEARDGHSSFKFGTEKTGDHGREDDGGADADYRAWTNGTECRTRTLCRAESAKAAHQT